MIRPVAVVLALVTALSVTLGAAAVLPVGKPAPLQVFEAETIPSVPPAVPSTTAPPDPVPPGPAVKVWVCVVLVDGHGVTTLKPGQNPIEVSVNSENAHDATDPTHPSYFAAGRHDTCQLPDLPGSQP